MQILWLGWNPKYCMTKPEEDTVVCDSGKYRCQAIHLNNIMEVSFPREPVHAVIQDAQVLLHYH